MNIEHFDDLLRAARGQPQPQCLLLVFVQVELPEDSSEAERADFEAGQGGALVNVSSVSSLASAPWHGPYGAAKSGVIALTRTMANEWQECGIRANSVSPGAVMSQRVIDKSANMSDAAKTSRAPSDTVIFSEPDELANAIVFLLSDLASGISGQNLTVDRALSNKFSGGARRSRKEMRELQQQQSGSA